MKKQLLLVAMLLSMGIATPVYAQPVSSIVQEVSQQHGVDPKLALAVAKVESNPNCRATGTSGERGVMQVKPATARGIGVHGNLYDCRTGAEAGVKYLKQAISKGGITCAGISLYNRGTGAKAVCTSYGRKVLAQYQRN